MFFDLLHKRRKCELDTIRRKSIGRGTFDGFAINGGLGLFWPFAFVGILLWEGPGLALHVF